MCFWEIVFLPFRLVALLFGATAQRLGDAASHSVGWSGVKLPGLEERLFVEEVVRSVEAIPLSRWKRLPSYGVLEARTDNGATIRIEHSASSPMSYSISVDGKEVTSFKQSSNSYTGLTQSGYIGVKRAVDRIVKSVPSTQREQEAPARPRIDAATTQQQIEAQRAERKRRDDILRKLK